MIDLESRIKQEAKIILKNGYTIREIAKILHLSKSTVHKDLTERLFKVDKDLYKNVKSILEYHKRIRHIRGGESTRNKYLKSKEG